MSDFCKQLTNDFIENLVNCRLLIIQNKVLDIVKNIAVFEFGVQRIADRFFYRKFIFIFIYFMIQNYDFIGIVVIIILRFLRVSVIDISGGYYLFFISIFLDGFVSVL